MSERPVVALLALTAFCALGFFVFPGHTYLQQDSQIYLPMMERIADPTVLANDLIATHPHLSFTVYDEIATGWKRLTGLDMQSILVAQQLLTRLLGIIGIFLLARSAGLAYAGATLVAGIFSLGATILGPSVLTFEYEPTPRAFALPVILFAAGLAAREMWSLAGAAAMCALLYHPPTAAPIVGLMVLYLLPPHHVGRRAFLPWLAGAGVILIVTAKLQAGVRLEQDFWASVSPDVEQLQRMRTAYVWVGSWIGRFWTHYLLLLVTALAAWWRVKRDLAPVTSWLLAAMPVLGVLALAANYVLLDIWKWGLMPQYQPARIVLFTTLSAIVTSSIASARARSVFESIAWLVIPFAVIIRMQPLQSFERVAGTLIIGLAVACALSLRAPLSSFTPAAVIVAAMYLIPVWGGVKNYPALHNEHLEELSNWARQSTPKDAVFHFADAGKDLAPGIFRAKALRAVWVDWKGGGQVNFMEPLAREWWRRWNGAPVLADFDVRTKACAAPVYRNAKYCVEPRPR